MVACLMCLRDVPGGGPYHADCVQSLFGCRELPAMDVELSRLYTLAATRMAGKMSISGAQEKVSLVLSEDGRTLDVAAAGGRYILKSETTRYSAIPQNEHLTMCLAREQEIEVPPFGLMRLQDDTVAYIIRRFDRPADGTKRQVEDFCQLAEMPPKDKYEGSAELCVRLLRRYASEPLIEIQKFFRLMLFSWWAGNGDMHLKNFSLMTEPDGIRRLSPAYDLVCTQLVIPDDALAMPVSGRTSGLTRRKWLDFADYCGIPRRAAERSVAEQIDAFDGARSLVEASWLSSDLRSRYINILQGHTAVLIG